MYETNNDANKHLKQQDRHLKEVGNTEKEAQKIKGEGDKKATEIWNNATGADPEFYSFYRSLEAYRNSFDDETSMVIAPEGEFFKYFGKSLK